MTKRERNLLAMLPSGCELWKRGTHWLVTRDDQVVRDEKGLPLTVACSPSDHRSDKNFASRVKRLFA